MSVSKIDLKAEQEKSLQRSRYNYSFAAILFFFLMDLVTGKKIILAKAKLLEILASIPYREWEIKQYLRLTNRFRKREIVEKSQKIIHWGREAQDNEYWHLLVINEKMKEDGQKDPWYLFGPITFFIVCTYIIISWLMARISIKRAFLFNAEFEDHAEHVYAQAVKENPQWETQPVTNALVKQYADVATWADVFRRIGLDERDHMNNSFYFCGKPELIVKYEGMPEV
jgi:hypothetical protein